MNSTDMPIGFGMALAMNPEAMQKYATLSEEQKQAIIDGTHAVNSKDEMHNYVSRILTDY